MITLAFVMLTQLPWVENDFDKAMAQGKAQEKPVFVDAWAVWCHSCLSMKAYVLTDPSLAPYAKRFVWTAIDTERPESAAFVKKYPLDNYPTFFVIDPADGSVAGRWIGSMSAPQLRTFLEEGERTVQIAHSGSLPPGDPLALLRSADKAVLEGRYADAAPLYQKSLAAAPAGWAHRPEALIGAESALAHSGQPGPCVDLALGAMDGMPAGPDAADVVIQGLGCAADLPKEDARVPRLRKLAQARLESLARDRKAPLSADDRGDILGTLMELHTELGDKPGATAAARERLSLLDAAAVAAPDAQAASTYDWARAESLLFLGRGADAEKMLKESEKRLPGDYNPPARLARVYLELGRYADGVAATDRALKLAYGPRKTTILGTRADLLEKMGKFEEAKAALEEQLAILKTLPRRRPGMEAAAVKRIEKLSR